MPFKVFFFAFTFMIYTCICDLNQEMVYLVHNCVLKAFICCFVGLFVWILYGGFSQ